MDDCLARSGVETGLFRDKAMVARPGIEHPQWDLEGLAVGMLHRNPLARRASCPQRARNLPDVDRIHINIHIIVVDTSWDPKNARTNAAKHGIAFEDAETALTDAFGLTREDPDARRERRFVTVGADALGRIVTVVYSYRGTEVRLISACPATRKETDAYAKGV